MKIIRIVSFCLLFLTDHIQAQNSINISSGYSYMKHSNLHGIFISNDFYFGKVPFLFTLGCDLNYANGNRNINKDVPGVFNYKLTNGDSIFVPWNRSVTDSSLISLPVKTSNTYQITIKTGMEYTIPLWQKLTCKAGLYFTYVNKSYLLGYFHDVKMNNAKADFLIPYYIRYFDVGSYLGINYQLFNNNKISIGVESLYFVGFKNNSWLNAGFYCKVKL